MSILNTLAVAAMMGMSGLAADAHSKSHLDPINNMMKKHHRYGQNEGRMWNNKIHKNRTRNQIARSSRRNNR